MGPPANVMLLKTDKKINQTVVPKMGPHKRIFLFFFGCVWLTKPSRHRDLHSSSRPKTNTKEKVKCSMGMGCARNVNNQMCEHCGGGGDMAGTGVSDAACAVNDAFGTAIFFMFI